MSLVLEAGSVAQKNKIAPVRGSGTRKCGCGRETTDGPGFYDGYRTLDRHICNPHAIPRCYQLKAGHCLTGQYLAWTTRLTEASCWCQYMIQTRENLFKNCPQWKSQQKTLWTTVLEETRKLPGPTRGKHTKVAELFADEWCSQTLLDFLATTHRWQKT